MAQPAYPLVGDQRSRPGSGVQQSAVHVQAGAQKWSGLERPHAVRKAHQSAGTRVGDLAVPAIHRDSGLLLDAAVDEVAAPTRLALAAVTVEIADPHAPGHRALHAVTPVPTASITPAIS